MLPRGRGRVIRKGAKAAFLSCGARLADCRSAAEELAGKGISAPVADARFVKPVNAELLSILGRQHEALVTVKEASIGGFAAKAAHFLARAGPFDGGLKFPRWPYRDRFLDLGAPQRQVQQAKSDAKKIPEDVRQALGCKSVQTRPHAVIG